MGEEIGPRLNSWDIQMARAQSGTSSFDEQLWEELEAYARRRRSQEGTLGYPGDPQGGPALTASPFASWRRWARRTCLVNVNSPACPCTPARRRALHAPPHQRQKARHRRLQLLRSPRELWRPSRLCLARHQTLLLARGLQAPRQSQ